MAGVAMQLAVLIPVWVCLGLSADLPRVGRGSAVAAGSTITMDSAIAAGSTVAVGSLRELIELERLTRFAPGRVSLLVGRLQDGEQDRRYDPRLGGYVLFDAVGPGCLYRIWLTDPPNSPLRFYLDDEKEPARSIVSFAQLFAGRYEPFYPPLVGSIGGSCYSYVPIPFAKRLRIVCDEPVGFFQFTWLKAADASALRSFDFRLDRPRRLQLKQILSILRRPGLNPHVLGRDVRRVEAFEELPASRTLTIMDSKGAGVLYGLQFRIEGLPRRRLRDVVLKITIDGNETPNVYSPVGDFFLDPFGSSAARTLPLGRTEDGTYYCYFPMPYGRSIRVELVNESSRRLKVSGRLTWRLLQRLPQQTLRFYARWRRENPIRPGRPFVLLRGRGRGRLVGVSLAAEGGAGLGFLDGPVQLLIDDADEYRTLDGDAYFGGGWLFRSRSIGPFAGMPVVRGEYGRVAAYRLHIADAIPFAKSVTVSIHHGRGDRRPADFAAVCYFYAAPGLVCDFKPFPLQKRRLAPLKLTGAAEAERIIAPAAAVMVRDDSTWPQQLSGGKAVISPADESDIVVPLRLSPPHAGTYRIIAMLLRGPDFGIVRGELAGRAIGPKVDCYSVLRQAGPSVVLGRAALSAGEHRLDLRCVGKSALSSGWRVGVDAIWLQPVPAEPNVLEAEQLLHEARLTDGCSCFVRNMRAFGLGFSGERILQFAARKGADSLALKVAVDRPGRYDLLGWFACDRDGGTYRVVIDGQLFERQLDTFSPHLKRLGPVQLARSVKLSAGVHRVGFVCIGRNRRSTGHGLGIDALSLRICEDPSRSD